MLRYLLAKNPLHPATPCSKMSPNESRYNKLQTHNSRTMPDIVLCYI